MVAGIFRLFSRLPSENDNIEKGYDIVLAELELAKRGLKASYKPFSDIIERDKSLEKANRVFAKNIIILSHMRSGRLSLVEGWDDLRFDPKSEEGKRYIETANKHCNISTLRVCAAFKGYDVKFEEFPVNSPDGQKYIEGLEQKLSYLKIIEGVEDKPDDKIKPDPPPKDIFYA